MRPETIDAMIGLPVLFAWFSLAWTPTERWVIKALRGTPEVVCGILAGLFAATFCVIPSMTRQMEYGVLRWLLDWPGFCATITLTMACISVPGRRMGEMRERVPAYATLGPTDPIPPNAYNRLVRWLDKPWRRILFRGAIALTCALVVLIVRGAETRPLILMAFYIGLRIFGLITRVGDEWGKD